MASTLPGNTLVVFLRIEHGKEIHDSIETEKKLYYVAGETDKDSREAVRQMAESNDVVIEDTKTNEQILQRPLGSVASYAANKAKNQGNVEAVKSKTTENSPNGNKIVDTKSASHNLKTETPKSTLLLNLIKSKPPIFIHDLYFVGI